MRDLPLKEPGYGRLNLLLPYRPLPRPQAQQVFILLRLLYETASSNRCRSWRGRRRFKLVYKNFSFSVDGGILAVSVASRVLVRRTQRVFVHRCPSFVVLNQTLRVLGSRVQLRRRSSVCIKILPQYVDSDGERRSRLTLTARS